MGSGLKGEFFYSIEFYSCLRVEKEETDIFGNKKRPGDISIDNIKGGRKVLYDVGITCPTKIGTLKQSAVESGYAAELFGKQKKDRVKEEMEKTNHVYQPLIVETFGNWLKESVVSINKIIFYYAERQKIELTKAKNIVWTELSVLLQKNNALRNSVKNSMN
jgi:hypothetical protein